MDFISLDLPAILTAMFSAIACALLGNYLVLRKLSLMGDAISHSVLPGIVIAFLLTSNRDSLTVFVGAAIAGILSAAIIEAVRKYGNVETGAAMGVVFSVFFALGVILIEQAAARSVDLDADCLLHGQLESIFWYPLKDNLFSIENIKLLPSEVITSFLTMSFVFAFVLLFYKELKIAAFDPALATALGFDSSLIHNILMFFVAISVVASFKAVGSILVIAMIICPAAVARFYTDKLTHQLIISALIATLCSFVGYILGAFGPIWLGYENSVSASGMIAVVSGILLTFSFIFAPAYGLFPRLFRQYKLAVNINCDEVLAHLYREMELAREVEIKKLEANYKLLKLTLPILRFQNLIRNSGNKLILTESGFNKATKLIRSHRLWERYLVDEVGLDTKHVHQTAAVLQNFEEPEVKDNELDPHGKPIPK